MRKQVKSKKKRALKLLNWIGLAVFVVAQYYLLKRLFESLI